MAKLILSMDGLVLKEVPLTKERTTIGRKPENDIHINNLAVSGEHAAIVTVVEDHFLEDLGSTNGTLVNGAPVKKHLLKNNDVIELGKYKLTFVGKSAPPAKGPADYEKTMVWRPATMKKEAEPAHSATQGPSAATATPAAPPTPTVPDSPAAAPAPATKAEALPAAIAPVAPVAPNDARPRGAIRILAGVRAGKELELTKAVTTLGKPGQQVALVTRRPQGFFISHAEGARQPLVNGLPIGTAPHPLNDHDIVELTGVKVEFLLRGARAAPDGGTFWKISLAVLGVLAIVVLVWAMRR